MQPHEQHDPEPGKPDPKAKQTKWLLFAIAILLGLVTSELVKRFM
jgi:hypothetical protein